jgi:hypothetical protein
MICGDGWQCSENTKQQEQQHHGKRNAEQPQDDGHDESPSLVEVVSP